MCAVFSEAEKGEAGTLAEVSQRKGDDLAFEDGASLCLVEWN